MQGKCECGSQISFPPSKKVAFSAKANLGFHDLAQEFSLNLGISLEFGSHEI